MTTPGRSSERFVKPPFLVVVDIGHYIDLYADFVRQGKTYTAFPDVLTEFKTRLLRGSGEEYRER